MTLSKHARIQTTLIGLVAAFFCTNAISFTVFSTKESLNGSGVFYGPGRLEDSELFVATIRNVSFTSESTFVTPFENNGGELPNVLAEQEIGTTPDGLFSDNKTRINENIDVGAMSLNGVDFLVAIAEGGLHAGEQISVLLENDVMLMTMDIVFDMGVGEAGIVRVPFYGTTGEVTVPLSVQSQLGIDGGIDRAGSIESGEVIKGRLGDFDNNGMLDGAIAVAGNLPLNSIFMPGAPYALIRNFETDMPYDGQSIGELPGTTQAREKTTTNTDHPFPQTEFDSSFAETRTSRITK